MSGESRGKFRFGKVQPIKRKMGAPKYAGEHSDTYCHEKAQ